MVDMIIPLPDAETQTSGAKAATLGALLRAGFAVPAGFVIPFHMEPSGLHGALGRGLHDLGDVPVAVRSSASNEDLAGSSAAGQYETVLAVRGAREVAEAVRTCWDSLDSPTAVDNRDNAGPSVETVRGDPRMAVIVQRLVDADVSGVMFTPDDSVQPTTIEASWGLGPSVVGGTVSPDTYRVGPDRSITRTVTDKQTRLDRDGSRLISHDVAAADRHRPALGDASVTLLAGLGREIAAELGAAQDIEWAISAGRPWILQARPITAAPPPSSRRLSSQAGAYPTNRELTGTSGSDGTSTGTARIVRGPADFARVCAGDILVCPYTDPAWTPLLRIVAGVVTEVGGVLAHAAIIARERRIPAVLGIPDATSTLVDGTTITIDGSAGTVTTAR